MATSTVTITTDAERLDWLQTELENAARNGLLLERLRDLGMRFLIYRDLREAIDAARAETAVETAGGAMSETMLPGTDVRERVDVPGLPDGITPLTGVFTTHHAGRPHAIVLWQGAPWLVWQHPDGHWVTEAKVQVAALRSESQGRARSSLICET